MLWALIRNLDLIPKAVGNHPSVLGQGLSELATVWQGHWEGVKAGSRKTMREAAAKV